MTLFGNWVVEVSFFGLRLINMCVMPCISFFPPQTVIACAKYTIIALRLCKCILPSRQISGTWWLLIEIFTVFAVASRFLYARAQIYKKTKRNCYCTKCGYIAIRCRMLPIQYAHENVTVLAIFIKLRMQFISIACGPIQIHRKSQRTAHNIL